MSYEYYATKRSPLSLWMLDDTVPFQEYTGFNASGGKKAGTADPTKSVPLAAGAVYSSVFKSGSIGQFACNVFSQGLENRPFALESWVLPVPKTVNNPAQPDVTNLFTNPGFETRGASYTLYTNLATNPAPASGTGYSAVNGSTATYVPAENGIHVTVASGGVADAGVGFNGQLSSVVLGNGYRYSVEIEAVIACTVKISIQGTTVSGGSFNITPVSFNAGEKKRITTPSVAAIASGNTNAYVLRGSTSAAEFIVRRVMQIQTTNDIEYFDGVTKTGLWNDADYTVAWNGTAHASTSRINALLPVGATASSNAKAVSSAVWSSHGSASLRITGSPYSSADSYVNVPLFGIVQEGKTYTVLATLRQNAILTGTFAGPSQQRNIFVDINGGGGGSRALGLTNPQANAPGVYYHRLTFTVPKVDGSPVTSMNMRLYNGYYAGNEVWWDDIVLVEGTYTGNYFDGSMLGYEWSGTANASISRSLKNVSRINYATNPHPTAFTTGATAIGPRNSYWHGVYTIENTSPPPGFTTYARKTANDPNGGATFQFGADSQDTPTVTAGNGMVVTAGDVMTTSAWVRYISTGYAGMNMKHTFYDNSGTRIAEQTIAPAPFPSNTWTRVSGTFTVPNNASRMQSRLEPKAGGVIGDSVDVTGLLFERSSTLNTYFDGSSIGSIWSGATSASVSYMLASAADQQILSHDGQFDGLSINGKVIRFGTAYANSGTAYCDYDLQEFKLAHVVGIHNKDQNQLWVNGQMVATVAITDAQKADTYVTTDQYLYSGYTISSQEVAMNAVAIYPTLSGEQIMQNYLAGLKALPQARVYPQYDGMVFDLDAAKGSSYIDVAWVGQDDFNTGLKNNVEYAPDQINPAYAGGISLAGSWTVAVPLDVQGDTSIYGVMLEWSSQGVTVDTSLDGTTWTPATSGTLISNIPNGYNPTGKDLRIRVSFAGGSANDESYLESLHVVAFRDNTINNPTVRPVTATYPAVVRGNFEPNLYRDDNGVDLNGGTLTIGTDTTADPWLARTLELWIKPVSGTPVISVGATKFRNGVADSTLPVGEWSLIHYVEAADITTPITITGDCIIGQAVLYPGSLTAADATFIFQSYTGTPTVRFADTSVIAVTEPSIPAAVYAHDWSISAAG